MQKNSLITPIKLKTNKNLFFSFQVCKKKLSQDILSKESGEECMKRYNKITYSLGCRLGRSKS